MKLNPCAQVTLETELDVTIAFSLYERLLVFRCRDGSRATVKYSEYGSE